MGAGDNPLAQRGVEVGAALNFAGSSDPHPGPPHKGEGEDGETAGAIRA